MNFAELGLKPEILDALAKLEYTTPTKIQEEVIKVSQDGKNIIGQSQTGTGKTGAFVISILQKIDLTKPGIKAIILAPTRELVTQTKDEIYATSKFMNLKSLSVYGGEPIYKQIKMLNKGQDIVIGTPGRVIDLIERGILKIAEIEFFVLDEVDRMLDMGFIDDIDFIWNKLKNLKQTFLFSATITPEIKGIVEKYLGMDYTFIKADTELTVAKIDHSFIEVPHIDKYSMLKRFIVKHQSEKTIVFVQTKRDTEVLAQKLIEDGLRASYLNGDMRQRERFRALKDFSEGDSNIFIVTDVASRGLNMKNVELVVNYDVPSDPESYIHRIGRTGRAGATGKAVMLVSRGEKLALRNIEKRNKITIKQVDGEGDEIKRTDKPDDYRGGGRGGNSRSRFDRRPSGGGRSSGGSRFGGERKEFGERKPFGEKKSFGDRDSSSRFGGEKKEFGERKSFGDRKPFGERSSSPRFGDKKNFGERKSFGERKPFGEKKEFGERKNFGGPSKFGERKPFGEKKSFGERKPFGEKKSFGEEKYYSNKEDLRKTEISRDRKTSGDISKKGKGEGFKSNFSKSKKPFPSKRRED
ncbi:DEAD/DEAH box helicase [Candidatus Gracilibacteria bacterium]|nr:DEAD/DEAH box helicase [Candidatus Gracilibacteria bacterium]